MKIFFNILLPLLLTCQNLHSQSPDPLSFFPHHQGDMWEYFLYEPGYHDTLQNFNIKDSVDTEGTIFVTQSARRINPIQPPYLFLDTAYYTIDSSYNVYGHYLQGGPGAENLLVYKLDAKQGDQWVVQIHQDSINIYGYEMARVREVWEDELFFGSGVYTIFKAYAYFYAQDSTDTLGLGRYGDVLTKGFGLWSRGGGDFWGDWYLKGCVINDTLYGDTTNVISSVKDLSENSPAQYELYHNFPNPFNPNTKISFKLKSSQNISLTVYDAMGKEVKRLIDNDFYYFGDYKISWNGKNNSNQLVSSGVYYYRLVNDSEKVTRSMILMK